jgi:forkhead transcription factor HCM1
MSNPPAAPRQPNVILTAPMAPHQQFSPQKHNPMSPSKQYFPDLNYVPIPPPSTASHIYTDSPSKRAAVPMSQQYRPAPAPMFTTFNSSFDMYEQENFPVPTSQDNFVDFPEPSCRKQSLKRSFSDAQVPTDRAFKRPRQEEEAIFTLPEPEDMPPVEDDGQKPQYSYAQMIGMAILRAPSRRLTLAQIYEWISNTFAFYREDTKQSWHNSIRHNLSLNKAFTKQERPKGDAGKGSYWVIEPGMEAQFVKDKSRRGNGMNQINVNSSIMRPDSQRIAQQLSDALAPNAFFGQPPVTFPRPQTAPALPELSSDATVPASDPALHETAEFGEVLPAPQSSPPDALNSSPPVMPSKHQRAISSPSRRLPRPSTSHRKQQSLTKNDDSGYFSSIESSVLKANKNNIILTSELDIEPMRKKRGRAEEEIVRIRSSSHDLTPSHGRSRPLTADPPQSSSPVHVSPATTLNPMTPAIVFKKPFRPPPSVSPNTQLLMHRKAMREFANSPIRSLGLFTDDTAYSPLKWSTFAAPEPTDSVYEILTDTGLAFTPATPVFGSSPIKRPSIGRAATSTNALSEILGNVNKLNAKTPTRGSLLNPRVRASYTGSPLKGGSAPSSAMLEQEDDLFDFKSFEHDNSDDNDEGVDISQGFEKIGGPTTQVVGGADHIRRPSLGRSFSSRI